MNSNKDNHNTTTGKSKKQSIDSLRDEWSKKWSDALAKLLEFGFEQEKIEDFLSLKNGEDDAENRLIQTIEILIEEKPLLWPEEHVVEELNKHHALIRTDSTYVLTELNYGKNSQQVDFLLETRQSFLNFYESRTTTDESGKIKTLAQIWLKSPMQRRFEKGLVFDPTMVGHQNGCYNLWRGFAVNPKPGSCKLFKDHIREIICSGDEDNFLYVWKWMASLVQHPEKRSTAILLMGSQGTGKGIFVQGLGHLFGSHFTHVDNLGHVVGKFNSHLKNSVLVFCDEALWGGDRRDIGRVKAMISEDKTIIEQKGRDAFVLPNFKHFIFASNEDWPLHLDKDDRRVMVLKISDERKNNAEYFRQISDELKNGGYEALLHELLSVDLTGHNSRELPNIGTAFSVKMFSASPSEKYIYECLLAGSFDIGNTQAQEGWVEKIPTNRVYGDYKAWCDQQSLSIEDKRQFAAKIYKVLPSTKRVRVGTGSQTYCLSFQNLDACRLEFQRSYQVDKKIWTDSL